MLVKHDVEYLKSNITQIVKVYFKTANNCEVKDDGSIVTSADIEISQLVSSFLKEHNFLSEEEEGSLCFPSYILDPIDGTREFYKGSSECACSLAYMASSKIADEGNWGWIFSPLSGFEISSSDLYTEGLEQGKKGDLIGMVSRSDSERGIFKDQKYSREGVKFVERGSIAFKLGLLAASACDFVFSATPKKIWDIAAGTVILHKKGYRLFNKQGEAQTLDSEFIEGPLLWCLEKDYPELKPLLEVN